MRNEVDILGLVSADSSPIPLTGVKVVGSIVGRGTKITVLQSFKNSEKKPVEAVYKFPLPEKSAICGLKARIGEKIIKGKIEEREKAFKKYDDSLIRGDGAYLLDEERPNIVTLSVGNLNPGATAVIEISYLVLLDTDGPEVRFFLPTTISPRYISKDTPDEGGIPVTSKIHSEYTADVSYGLSVSLDIKGENEIASVESPSHKTRTDFSSDNVKIDFSSDTVKMERDFVLNIKYKESFQSRGYIFKKDGHSYAMVDFTPDAKQIISEETVLPQKEVIFLLRLFRINEGMFNRRGKKIAVAFFKRR